MDLKREDFEPPIDELLEMNDLDAEVVLSFLTERGRKEIRTCPGDIYKIVNALMDYARMLELAIVEWNLGSFKKATYEYHAEQCRAIAQKYAQGIGYDYEKAVERCQKQRARRSTTSGDDGVGEDALVLAMRKKSAGDKPGAGDEPGAG